MVCSSCTPKDLLRRQFVAVGVVLGSYEVDVSAEFLEELARDGIARCWAGLDALSAIEYI